MWRGLWFYLGVVGLGGFDYDLFGGLVVFVFIDLWVGLLWVMAWGWVGFVVCLIWVLSLGVGSFGCGLVFGLWVWGV